MAGHSKWANIQHRKGRQDAKRGKIFTRLIKEITVASRLGGSDITANPRLRLAVDPAYPPHLPQDTVQPASKPGRGARERVTQEASRREGTGTRGSPLPSRGTSPTGCRATRRSWWRTAGTARSSSTLSRR